jgi:hypothetical protein
MTMIYFDPMNFDNFPWILRVLVILLLILIIWLIS